MLKRPVLRYYGGGWSRAAWTVSYFPHHDSYLEPCLGLDRFFSTSGRATETAQGFSYGRRLPSALYAQLYGAAGWTRVEKSARTNSGGRSIEALWLSPAVISGGRQNTLPLEQLNTLTVEYSQRIAPATASE